MHCEFILVDWFQPETAIIRTMFVPVVKKQVRFLPSFGLKKSMSSLGYPNHGIQTRDT
jgi:hypothetical protein